jgi:hypothetical protein
MYMCAYLCVHVDINVYVFRKKFENLNMTLLMLTVVKSEEWFRDVRRIFIFYFKCSYI